MPSTYSLGILKSRTEILESFGKIRESKIFKIFGAGGASKNLGDFWSRDPYRFWSGFPRDLSLFDYLLSNSAENINPGGIIKIF